MARGGGETWGPALLRAVTCRLDIARRERGMGWRREPSGPPLFRVVACRQDIARRERGVSEGFWWRELSGRAFLRLSRAIWTLLAVGEDFASCPGGGRRQGRPFLRLATRRL